MAEAKKKATKKTPAKESSSGKNPVKKASPAKKKTAPRKQTKTASKSWGDMSIAERTTFRKRNKKTILACVSIISLLLAAGFFQFCVAGYSFSACICAGIAGLIAFYTFVPKIFKKSRTVISIVTVLLCIFLIAAAITEGLIIQASFGNAEVGTEYLIVLGAKVRSDGPSLSLQNRIDAAYDYLTAHPDTIAVASGGQGPDEPITEAQCIYDSLVALGIAPSRIWMEDKATSTWENLQFSLNLIEEKTGQRPVQVAVLSSEYHLFRASLFARACGVEFIGVPAETTILSLKINYFLREIAGVWHYIILGGHYHA